MKCKICKEEINLQVFGLPNDICWGCANSEKKDEVLDLNIKSKKVKK